MILDRPGLNRYDLYELAVQHPDLEVRFLHAVHGGSARVLSEDFAGPASLCRAWVSGSGRAALARSAVAVDTAAEPLEHGQRRAAEELSPRAAARITWRRADVRRARDATNIIAALNFGVCELHEREDLLAYLRSALRRLRAGGRGGVLVCDLYAGPGAMRPGSQSAILECPPPHGEIRYTWEQRAADPLTGRVLNAMHFDLPHGLEVEGAKAARGARAGGKKSRTTRSKFASTLRNAFTYDWRLWGIAELRDAMREAGFRQTQVYTRYAHAVSLDGELLARPATAEEVNAEEDFVAYVAARA